MTKKNVVTDEVKKAASVTMELSAALAAIREMTALQLVAYAAREFKQTLKADNGRTWLLKKVGYLVSERAQGGLTGVAAERAAALDKPETVTALKAEEKRIEAQKHNNPDKSEKGGAMKTTKNTKPESTKGDARRTYALTDKIAILVKENPKRTGSAAHDRFTLYSKHKTVESYLAAGGSTADIVYDTKHGFIKVAA